MNNEESSEMLAMFPRPIRGPLAMAEAADEASELMRMMSMTRYSEMDDEEIMREILESGAPPTPAQGNPASRGVSAQSMAAASDEFHRRRTSRRNGYILGKLMDISTAIDSAYGDLLMLGEPASHADVQWSRVLLGIGTFLRQAGRLTGAAYQAIEARERYAYHANEARRQGSALA